MVQVNFASKDFKIKIVYYGPGMSGKTTNLEVVHAKAPASAVGELVSIATEGDRTLVFDYMPLEIGRIGGMQAKFQLYTVPGQTFYGSTRRFVLQGVDGIIFIADSQKGKMRENLESLLELYKNLKGYGLNIQEMPLAIQWNKRDLPELIEVELLNKKLNLLKSPNFEAVAIDGQGVFSCLKSVMEGCLHKLQAEYGGEMGEISFGEEEELLKSPEKELHKSQEEPPKRVPLTLESLSSAMENMDEVSVGELIPSAPGESPPEPERKKLSESALEGLLGPGKDEKKSSEPEQKEIAPRKSPTIETPQESPSKAEEPEDDSEAPAEEIPTTPPPKTPMPKSKTAMLEDLAVELRAEEEREQGLAPSPEFRAPLVEEDGPAKDGPAKKRPDQPEKTRRNREQTRKKIPSKSTSSFRPLIDTSVPAPSVEIDVIPPEPPTRVLSKKGTRIISSSAKIPGAFRTCTSQEALELILKGKTLQDLEIPFLDLSNQFLTQSLVFHNVKIGRFRGFGTTFKEPVQWEKVLVEQIELGGDPLDTTNKARGATRFESACSFTKVMIQKKADFRGVIFNGPLHWKRVKTGSADGFISFYHATFAKDFTVEDSSLGAVDLRETCFMASCQIANSTFSKNVNSWKGRYEAPVTFENNTFFDKVLFLEAIFEDSLQVHNCEFQQISYFGESSFRGEVDFRENRFLGEALFQKSIFSQEAKFSSLFKKEVYFRNALFEGDCDFTGGCFENKISLKGVIFLGLVTFTDMDVHSMVLDWQQIEGKLKSEKEGLHSQAMDEYSLLKNMFEKQNQYSQMDEAYYCLRRMRRKKLALSWDSPLESFQKAMEFLFLDLICGYGTRPFRLILSSLGLVFFFGLLYWMHPMDSFLYAGGMARGVSMGFFQSLYFSVATFASRSTFWIPHPHSTVNLWIGIESLVGVVMIFLFVLTCARKFFRS